jgi:hypothetical protein
MERSKWETAIRCLEVALHPNTEADEVLAGVNGFRRLAAGTPISEVCREYADAEGVRADTIDRQNLDLRRRLERERAEQLAALRRLQEAERQIRALSEEIRAEQQSFAEFRAASEQIVDGLKDENFDLRGALQQAERTVRVVVKPSPFRQLLAAALDGDAISPPLNFPATPRHPWTA